MGAGPATRAFGGGLMAFGSHTSEPVPLYLIPQTIAEEVRKYGDSIAEVRVRRTSGHCYLINIRHEVRGERHE